MRLVIVGVLLMTIACCKDVSPKNKEISETEAFAPH